MLRNFGLVVGSRLLNAALGFCLTLLLFELPRDGSGDFGKYSFYVALAGSIPFWVNLGIDKSFVTFTSTKEDEGNYLNYLGLFWKSKLILAFLTFLGCLAYFLLAEQRTLIMVALLSGLVFGFSESFKPPAESKKNFNFVSVIVPIRNLVLVIFAVILMAKKALTLQNIVLALFIANGVNLLVSFLLYRIYVAPFTVKTTLSFKTLFQDTKWLFIKEFVQNYASKTEIFLLSYFVGAEIIPEEERTYFAGAFSLCMVLPILTNSLTKVLLPTVTNIKQAENLKIYIRKLTKTLFISVPAAIAFLTAIYFFVNEFKPDYKNSLPLMPIIILGTFFTFYTNNISLIFYRKGEIHFVSIVAIIQFISGAIICYTLIPLYGAMGAVLSLLSVRIIGFIITLIKTRTSLYGATAKIGE